VDDVFRGNGERRHGHSNLRFQSSFKSSGSARRSYRDGSCGFAAFYVDTARASGLDETDRRVYLRAMEERGHHCIVLAKGDIAVANELGFKVFDDEHLDKAKSFFDVKACRPNGSRCLIRGDLQTRDPQGIPLEFYARMDRLPRIHQKYALYRGVKRCGSIISTASARRQGGSPLLQLDRISD